MSRTARKFSRNLNFSYRPGCHHCVGKLSGLFKRFHIDHKVVAGRIDPVRSANKCMCLIEGKADRLTIGLVRSVFKRHRDREVGFLQDIECKKEEV